MAGQIRSIQPSPAAVPQFNVLSYAAQSILPIGLSADRKTVYGSAGVNGSTQLSQSTDDGATWSNVYAFPQPVTALLETDDGEAIVIVSTSGGGTSSIYKSTGWAASHTAATWASMLTSASAAFFRPLWAATAFSAGLDSYNGTGKYLVIGEYGTQKNVASPTDPKYPTHAYFSQDYGRTWVTILDLQTFFPTQTPLHCHCAAYDPYWDRIWVTFGDSTHFYDDANGKTQNMSCIFSDDHGVTWNPLLLPPEWASLGNGGSFTFQCTSIAVLEDAILFAADNTPGFMRLSRGGYRTLGKLGHAMVCNGHTGSTMIGAMAWRCRGVIDAPLLATMLLIGDAEMAGCLFASLDAGRTFVELFRDDSMKGNATDGGLSNVYGPTYSGKVLAVTQNSGKLLRGEIVPGDPGTINNYANLTGDGSTTAFSVPHYVANAPSRFSAYPQNAAAVSNQAAGLALSVTAANLVFTFTTAPASGAALSFATRVGA